MSSFSTQAHVQRCLLPLLLLSIVLLVLELEIFPELAHVKMSKLVQRSGSGGARLNKRLPLMEVQPTAALVDFFTRCLNDTWRMVGWGGQEAERDDGSSPSLGHCQQRHLMEVMRRAAPSGSPLVEHLFWNPQSSGSGTPPQCPPLQDIITIVSLALSPVSNLNSTGRIEGTAVVSMAVVDRALYTITAAVVRAAEMVEKERLARNTSAQLEGILHLITAAIESGDADGVAGGHGGDSGIAKSAAASWRQSVSVVVSDVALLMQAVVDPPLRRAQDSASVRLLGGQSFGLLLAVRYGQFIARKAHLDRLTATLRRPLLSLQGRPLSLPNGAKTNTAVVSRGDFFSDKNAPDVLGILGRAVDRELSAFRAFSSPMIREALSSTSSTEAAEKDVTATVLTKVNAGHWGASDGQTIWLSDNTPSSPPQGANQKKNPLPLNPAVMVTTLTDFVVGSMPLKGGFWNRSVTTSLKDAKGEKSAVYRPLLEHLAVQTSSEALTLLAGLVMAQARTGSTDKPPSPDTAATTSPLNVNSNTTNTSNLGSNQGVRGAGADLDVAVSFLFVGDSLARYAFCDLAQTFAAVMAGNSGAFDGGRGCDPAALNGQSAHAVSVTAAPSKIGFLSSIADLQKLELALLALGAPTRVVDALSKAVKSKPNNGGGALPLRISAHFFFFASPYFPEDLAADVYYNRDVGVERLLAPFVGESASVPASTSSHRTAALPPPPTYIFVSRGLWDGIRRAFPERSGVGASGEEALLFERSLAEGILALRAAFCSLGEGGTQEQTSAVESRCPHVAVLGLTAVIPTNNKHSRYTACTAHEAGAYWRPRVFNAVRLANSYLQQQHRQRQKNTSVVPVSYIDFFHLARQMHLAFFQKKDGIHLRHGITPLMLMGHMAAAQVAPSVEHQYPAPQTPFPPPFSSVGELASVLRRTQDDPPTVHQKAILRRRIEWTSPSTRLLTSQESLSPVVGRTTSPSSANATTTTAAQGLRDACPQTIITPSKKETHPTLCEDTVAAFRGVARTTERCYLTEAKYSNAYVKMTPVLSRLRCLNLGHTQTDMNIATNTGQQPHQQQQMNGLFERLRKIHFRSVFAPLLTASQSRPHHADQDGASFSTAAFHRVQTVLAMRLRQDLLLALLPARAPANTPQSPNPTTNTSSANAAAATQRPLFDFLSQIGLLHLVMARGESSLFSDIAANMTTAADSFFSWASTPLPPALSLPLLLCPSVRERGSYSTTTSTTNRIDTTALWREYFDRDRVIDTLLGTNSDT